MGKYNERKNTLLDMIGAIASILSAVISILKMCASIINYLQQKSNRQAKR